MYDINYDGLKQKKKIMGVAFICCLAAAIFVLLLGIIIEFGNENQYDASAKVTKIKENEIRSYDEEYGAEYVEYEYIYYYKVNGKTYTYALPDYEAASIIPDGVFIYYNSENPKECIASFEKTNPTSATIPVGTFLVLVSALFFILVLQTNKRIKEVKYLATQGTLIKGLPCTITNLIDEGDGTTVIGKVINVRYTTKDGRLLKLRSDPIYHFAGIEGKKTADLLIDENNTNLYYIQFEIDPKRRTRQEAKSPVFADIFKSQPIRTKAQWKKPQREGKIPRRGLPIDDEGPSFVEMEKRREAKNDIFKWL